MCKTTLLFQNDQGIDAFFTQTMTHFTRRAATQCIHQFPIHLLSDKWQNVILNSLDWQRCMPRTVVWFGSQSARLKAGGCSWKNSHGHKKSHPWGQVMSIDLLYPSLSDYTRVKILRVHFFLPLGVPVTKALPGTKQIHRQYMNDRQLVGDKTI